MSKDKKKSAASACPDCGGAPVKRSRENHRLVLVGNWSVTLEESRSPTAHRAAGAGCPSSG
jgi:hypothetical protein